MPKLCVVMTCITFCNCLFSELSESFWLNLKAFNGYGHPIEGEQIYSFGLRPNSVHWGLNYPTHIEVYSPWSDSFMIEDKICYDLCFNVGSPQKIRRNPVTNRVRSFVLFLNSDLLIMFVKSQNSGYRYFWKSMLKCTKNK